MKSTGASSPTSRLTTRLVAGKALGVTWNSVRLFEFVIDKDLIETITQMSETRTRESKALDHTTILVFEIDCGPIVRPASDQTHIGQSLTSRDSLARKPFKLCTLGDEQADKVAVSDLRLY